MFPWLKEHMRLLDDIVELYLSHGYRLEEVPPTLDDAAAEVGHRGEFDWSIRASVIEWLNEHKRLPKTEFELLCRHAMTDMRRESAKLSSGPTEAGLGARVCVGGSFVDWVEATQNKIARAAEGILPDLCSVEQRETWPIRFFEEHHEGEDSCYCVSTRDPLGGQDRTLSGDSGALQRGYLKKMVGVASECLHRWCDLAAIRAEKSEAKAIMPDDIAKEYHRLGSETNRKQPRYEKLKPMFIKAGIDYPERHEDSRLKSILSDASKRGIQAKAKK